MAIAQLQLLPGFLLISSLLVFDSQAFITNSPKNVLTLQNTNVTLNCSTNSSSTARDNPIRWQHDHDIISHTPCRTEPEAGFETTASDPATDCNIVALAGGSRVISGPYACSDGTRLQAVAMVILLESTPICGPVVPVSSVDENDSVDFSCSMSYRWHSKAEQSNVVPLLNVSFGWEQDSNGLSTKQLFRPNVAGNEVATMTVAAAKKPIIPSQECTIRFTFSPAPRYRFKKFAVNPVWYTCRTDPIPVRYCPTTVTVSPSSGPFKAGDALTCTSDGYPEPSIRWTDSNGVVVSTNSSITLDSTSFNLTCTVTGNMKDDCSASISISDTDRTTTVPTTTVVTTTVLASSVPTTVTTESTLSTAIVTTIPPPIAVYYVTPRRHIITGGTTVYVQGAAFTRVREARLIVTTIYTSYNGSGFATTQETNFSSALCAINNSSLLTCVIPIISLTAEFRNLDDPSLTFPYNDQALYYSPVMSYSDRNSTLEFTECVLLDGERYLLSNESVLQFIGKMPTITDSGQRVFNGKPQSIQGIGLHRGVTRASDYTVLLGDGHCTPTELRSDVLQCDAPESAPNVSTDDNAQCNDSFAMIVMLGGRVLGSAGCLSYPEPSPAPAAGAGRNSVVYIIVIVGTIGVAIIIILLAIVIRSFLRCRRTPEDEDRKPLEPPKDARNVYVGNKNGSNDYGNSGEFSPSTDIEMSEYGNASEFRHARHATSDVGCY